MSEGYTEEEVREAEKDYKHEQAERIGKEYGLNPSMIELYGGESAEDMETFAKVVVQNIKRESGEEARSGEETQAEREKREIYEPHYEATMEEVSNFNAEQYQAWRDRGAHIKASELDEIATEEARVEEQARAEEVERLERLSMAEYAKEVNRRDKENG